ncbi:hypothetical protein AZE42_06232 [Rhizopogon vesiculosus]|uniref:Uncharacterized protein n=1 Tax=Rhizopogon vesiculosus TaxID=180088 RepID=A0A1J8Q473_9AGAM|nr:hypothetical protein AZE42_06232 [Rhizopogon vesiculosus]
MAAQYSPDVIAAAMSLQTYTYMYVSMATFWVGTSPNVFPSVAKLACPDL